MTDVRQVGDWRVPTIDISTYAGLPAGGTVTCSVLDPDGTAAANAMSAGSATATATPWTGTAYQLTKSGEWIERFTVTGDGQGYAETRVWVQAKTSTVPTGMRVYATTGDYADSPYTSVPPADLDVRRLLLVASGRIDEMLIASIYETDSVTLLPTDTAVIAALRDATVAQAAYQAEIGDPYGLGVDQYQSVAIGGVNLGRSYTGAGGSVPGRFSAEAARILSAAGLSGGAPLTFAWWS